MAATPAVLLLVVPLAPGPFDPRYQAVGGPLDFLPWHGRCPAGRQPGRPGRQHPAAPSSAPTSTDLVEWCQATPNSPSRGNGCPPAFLHRLDRLRLAAL
jgi:hypothetical protein